MCAISSHKVGHAVVLDRAYSNRCADELRSIHKHVGRGVSLGYAVGLRYLCVHHQSMPVISQHMRDVAKHRARATTLAKQPDLTFRAGLMRVVSALLAMSILVSAITSIRWRVVVRVRLPHEAFVSGPVPTERAVHAEVLARQVATHARRLAPLIEQADNDAVGHQSVGVLAEGEVVPHFIVVGDSLHQHAFTANRIHHLRQQCRNQLRWRDAGATSLRIALVRTQKERTHACGRIVEPQSNRSQRVMGWNEVIQPEHR